MRDMPLNLSSGSRNVVLAITTLVILGLVNSQIASKEKVLSDGHVVLLRLAPQDPRSLLQGDYMALRYQMAGEVADAARQAQLSNGIAVIRVDEDGVATFDVLYDGRQLASGQLKLRFRKRGDAVRLASDAYFFEEGDWQTFEAAVYGELAVDESGDAVLTGLRNGDLERLGPLFGP